MIEDDEERFELKYICDGRELTISFNSELNIFKMQEHLNAFLLAAGYNQQNIDRIFKDKRP